MPIHKILGGLDENTFVFGVKARELTAYLTYYNTLFLVGDCGDADKSEWTAIKGTTLKLVKEVKDFDTDGPSLLFINSSQKVENKTDETEFSKAFDRVTPAGTSYIGDKLKNILNKYNERAEAAHTAGGTVLDHFKPLSIIVVSDGDFDDVNGIINDIKGPLDTAQGHKTKAGVKRQVGIQFVQVGNDARAAADDAKLANKLPADKNVLDSVHYDGTSTFGTDLLYRILLGAINPDVAKFLSDPETPWTGPTPLKSNQVSLWIPNGKTATIGVETHAALRQQVIVSTYPGTPGLAVYEGVGQNNILTPKNDPNATITVKGGVFVYFDFNYWQEAAKGTHLEPSRIKLLSKDDHSVYKFGSDDDNWGTPDNDFTDSIATITIV